MCLNFKMDLWPHNLEICQNYKYNFLEIRSLELTFFVQPILYLLKNLPVCFNCLCAWAKVPY